MSPHRVSALILAVVLLFVGILAGMREVSLEEERAAAMARADGAMRSLARVAEQYAQRVFETSELIANQVVTRVAELGGTATLRGNVGVQHWLQDLSRGSAGNYLLVVDAAGTPVAASFDLRTGANLADQRWFRAHRDGAETHVGEALHSRVTDELLFTYSRMLRRPDGAFDGAVQVAMRGRFFQEAALATEFGEGAEIGLFDREGRVLARTGLTPEQISTGLAGNRLLELAAREQAGALEAVLPFDAERRLVAFRRLDSWPLLVIASVPVEQVLSAWQAAREWSANALAAVAVVLGALGLVAIRLAGREASARQALAKANDALREAAGALEARVATRTRDLAASEARFRAIFDSAFQLMVLLDSGGRLVEANGTALAFLGLTRAEALGRHAADLPCWPEEATRDRLASAVADAGRGIPRREEMAARAGDGRLAPLDLSFRPIRDAEGGTRWIVTEGHDLTELKLAEARLREAHKMEALGQLTGGVAHDFNNLLMVVLGNLGLLRKRLPQEPRLMRLLDGAQQGAERGAALTARMLAFARRQELRPEPVALAELVRGLSALLERSAGPRVRLVLDLPEQLPPALVDANQLELALLNLVVNARDAMPDGGTVTISVAERIVPSPSAPQGLLPGHYLLLTVRDAGMGMDPATLARATEPFFTTKGVGRGSGLGLSMVQGLAQQSGGGLKLESRPGQGTVATIWLPRAEASKAAPTPSTPPAEQSPRPAPRRVLVVDDDPLVATGTAMMLEDLGHSTVIAQGAEEALARLAQDPHLQLVLTDHAMPGMTGLELAERLRRERPDLPVVLATGHAEASTIAVPWLPRLGKPYRQEELDALVRRLTQPRAA